MTTWGNSIQSRAEQRELKRLAILRAAAQSFNTIGYHQTNLNDLAETLGVTKPALYRYVEGKQDILRQCLAIAMAEVHEAIDELEAQKEQSSLNGREQLKKMFVRFAQMSSDDFGACLILSRGAVADDIFREQYNETAREIMGAMGRFVEMGKADGSIQVGNGRLLIAAMLGSINESVYWHQREGRVAPEIIAEEVFGLFENRF